MLRSFNFRLSLIMALFFTLLYAGCAVASNGVDPKERKKPKIHFVRGLQEKPGKGGFAYQGMRKKYQIEDSVLAAVESAPKGSAWFSSEKAFFRNLLKNESFDVLVVPFQTQLDGVDPIGRSLMSYRLATEIEKRTPYRVAPMPLVHFAMGSHARFYEDASIYALAKQIGVSHIVWGYAGSHEDKLGHVQSLDITIVHQSKEAFGSPEASRCKSWIQHDLKSNQLPSVFFESNLSGIMSFIDFPVKKNPKHVGDVEAKHTPMKIPKTPEALFHAKFDDPISKSYCYQFMGMLIPTRAEYHRQYMFIRSLTTLLEADPRHPDYPILKARAYHHLYRRPEAIKILENIEGDRARLLKNMINGNLLVTDANDKLLTAPTMDGFFAAVEYAGLMYEYKKKLPKQLISDWIDKYPEWKYFYALTLNDKNIWDVPQNMRLKQILDKIYPVKGATLENLVNKLIDRNQSEKMGMEIDLVFQDHLRESLSSHATDAFGGTHTGGPTPLDHHILFEGVGISNLLKQLYYLFRVQGLPEASMALSTDYRHRYQGHPYFVIWHADILINTAVTMQGEERQNTIDQSVSDTILGLWWYGRQGWAFPKAHSVLTWKHASKSEVLNKFMPYKRLLYGVASDYPLIPECARSGYMRPYQDLVDWNSSDIADLQAVVTVYRRDKEMMDLMRNQAKGRFIGHPARHIFEIATESASKGKIDKKRPYIQMIDKGSDNWKIYRKLGKMYAREGDYQNAQKVFQRYPGFSENDSDNRVRISNRAYSAGSILFWQGAYREARQFYDYSSKLDTGSSSCLTSRARVALLDRDFNRSRDIMLRNAKRYDTSYRYRDYMALSHLLGDSQKAWKQFTSVLGRYSSPHIWTSAFVGHRVQKTSKSEIKHWINSVAESNQVSRQRSFPARYAFMCLIDRSPDMEFSQFVETVDDLSRYNLTHPRSFSGPDGKYIGPDRTGRLNSIEYFLRGNGAPLSKQEQKKIMKKYNQTNIPKEPFSFYGSLALAYENMKNKNYGEAYAILRKQSSLYSYDFEFGKPAKAYLVWAGVKSGKEKVFELFLKHKLYQSGIKPFPGAYEVSPEHISFDDELSLAAYLCGTGNNDQAIERIREAFLKRPHTEERPVFSWYQIVEFCEWFYEHSNDSRYLDIALKWVKDYQIIQPMFGWAYAFEAKYAKNEQEKLRALGHALYLDAASWRIAHFSNAEKKAAIKWFERHGDFGR